MIIVQLNGGLGNQMFQYALGRSLSIERKDKLYLDTWVYRHLTSIDTKREYELDSFLLVARTCPSIVCNICNVYLRTANKLKQYINLSFPYLPNYILEQSNLFDPHIFELKKNIYLSGYWQSEKYFIKHRKIILGDFSSRSSPISTKNAQLEKDIKKHQSVSIHIRRTDYLTNENANKFHGVCGLNYYRKSMKYIEKKVTSPVYYVFSDDPDWVRLNIKSKHKVVYITHNQGKDAHEDIRLMSQCQHNIIANSSFSWWGAWLNSHRNKMVISPKRWFNSSLTDTSDLIPQNWIKL